VAAGTAANDPDCIGSQMKTRSRSGRLLTARKTRTSNGATRSMAAVLATAITAAMTAAEVSRCRSVTPEEYRSGRRVFSA
jgi:hypothetical protein